MSSRTMVSLLMSEPQNPKFPSPTLAEEILGAIGSIVLVGNSLGQVVYASPALREILGYEPEEVLGDQWWRLPNTDREQSARDQEREKVAKMAAGKMPVPAAPYTTRMRARDGKERWILWRDAKGPGDLIIGVGQDVTQLHEREAEFRTIFDNASTAMLILNGEWEYTDVNPAACKIYGMQPEQIIGHRHGTLGITKVDTERIQREALKHGSASGEVEFTLSTGDVRQAEYFVTTNVRPGYHLLLMLDITERRRLETQLTQAMRLEAVGRLAGGVAHDFNNMLTAIRGYSELLLRNTLDRTMRRYAEGIMGAADRATQTTQQLLAFSRRQTMQPERVNINNAVRDASELLTRLIGEDIELITLLDEDAGEAKVDPSQFGQILVNLAVNSRDAMPEGGKLIVETRSVTIDDAYVMKHIQVIPGTYVLLTVTDTGTGMPPEVKSHMFEPFFTTKSQGKGTGLGLAMVYGIVKQSGGYIWVYSEPGEGTSFKIYLPRVDRGPHTIPVMRPRVVLVIEDDEATRTMAAEALRNHGFVVVEAVDGVKALAACEGHRGSIDLILTDMTAPGMTGEDLLGYFAVRYPIAKVIHMSGFPERRMQVSHALPPGSEFLAKPFTMAQLMEKVNKALGLGE